MSQENEELEPELQKLSPEVQAMLRQGRKAQKEAEQAKAEKSALELQMAIKDAGVPDHPARDVVFKEYAGSLDAESVKAHAEKFGIVASSAPVDNGPSDQEREAQRQILNAGGGAPASSGDVDLAVALRNAKNEKEVMAIVGQMAGQPGFRSHNGLIGVLSEI